MKDINKAAYKANFGKSGWGTILYCLLMFFFYVGMVNDGTNALAPAVAKNIGCLPGTLIQLNGYAGMVGVLGFIIVGQINRKLGARTTSAIFTIIAGVAYIICGNAPNQGVYFVAMSIQPSEIVKLAFIWVGAASLDELFRKKNSLVFTLFSGFCFACLALMGDFGTAIIFFVTFLVISFLRSGDFTKLILILGVAFVGGLMVLRFKAYVAARFAVWGHVHAPFWGSI